MKTLTIFIALMLVGVASLAAQQDKITYDKHGRISSVRYANGQEIRYEYDEYNNLTSTRSVVASVENNTAANFTITVKPNPASQHVTVEVPAQPGTAVTFRVVTLDGRQVLRRQVLSEETGVARTTIDRTQDGIAPGQYQVSVATSGGRSTTSVTFSE